MCCACVIAFQRNDNAPGPSLASAVDGVMLAGVSSFLSLSDPLLVRRQGLREFIKYMISGACIAAV